MTRRLTPFIDIDHPLYCENESKISLVLRVYEKQSLVIAEFKLFSARYKDGKFTFKYIEEKNGAFECPRYSRGLVFMFLF